MTMMKITCKSCGYTTNMITAFDDNCPKCGKYDWVEEKVLK